MPIIIFCYIIVNLSFFAVLSVNELASSTAVALVSCSKKYNLGGRVDALLSSKAENRPLLLAYTWPREWPGLI